MLLRGRVKRGGDGVTAAGDLLVVEALLLEPFQGVVAEEAIIPGSDAAIGFTGGLLRDSQWLGGRVIGLLLGEGTAIGARLENLVAAGQSGVRVIPRVQCRGGLDDPGEECGLGVRQLLGGMVEVGAGGGLDPVGTAAKEMRLR